MYIPNYFRFEDMAEKIAFINKYSFATIVTYNNGIPVATHLPFVAKQRGDALVLSAHFSIANHHAQCIENGTSLVIFAGPHAYISTTNYEKAENVPTWNYIAVHAYGNARILHTDEEKLVVLEEMIQFYDAAYSSQWATLPGKFKTGMLKGIVAFELEVEKLEGKKKLSQNRTPIERENIKQQLQHSPAAEANDLATYMQDAHK